MTLQPPEALFETNVSSSNVYSEGERKEGRKGGSAAYKTYRNNIIDSLDERIISWLVSIEMRIFVVSVKAVEYRLE